MRLHKLLFLVGISMYTLLVLSSRDAGVEELIQDKLVGNSPLSQDWPDSSDSALPPETADCSYEPLTANRRGDVSFLEDPGIRRGIRAMWVESYGLDDDPLPFDERMEHAGFVFKTASGGYRWEDADIIDNTACWVHFSYKRSDISSMHAVVHTHPFRHLERYPGNICGGGDEDSTRFLSHVSRRDSTQAADPPLNAVPYHFVIDGTFMRFYRIDRRRAKRRIERCGY